MIKITRHIATGVLGAIALPGAALHAQAETQSPPPPPAQTQPGTAVGNPQLRDFELRGTQTLPAPAEQPAAPPPQPQQQPQPQPRPPVVESRPPQPQAERPAPAPVRPQPQAQTAAPEPAPPPAAETSPPAATPDLPETITPVPEFAPEAPPSSEIAPIPAPAEPAGFPWLYAGLAALLAMLAFAAFRHFRSRRSEDESVAPVAEPTAPEAAPAVPAAPPAPQPAPANAGGLVSIPTPRAGPRAPATPSPAPSAPAPSGLIGIQVRPWLELEFKPDRAAATLTDTSVQYQLTIRNKGNAPARNVRIEARMFNAGFEQEQEIGTFFGEPVRERTAPAVASIPARSEIRINSTVSMPKELVREITVEGRRLFVPMVAFNVVYDWGDNRSGQTSTSYLVGREAEQPAEKMGAFRLDLGPRLYRSVGQRQTKLARIV